MPSAFIQRIQMQMYIKQRLKEGNEYLTVLAPTYHEVKPTIVRWERYE